jgi:hypothetical protein
VSKALAQAWGRGKLEVATAELFALPIARVLSLSLLDCASPAFKAARSAHSLRNSSATEAAAATTAAAAAASDRQSSSNSSSSVGGSAEQLQGVYPGRLYGVDVIIQVGVAQLTRISLRCTVQTAAKTQTLLQAYASAASNCAELLQ